LTLLQTPLPRCAFTIAFTILQVGVVPVTAEPGHEGAGDAAARGYLRASHADREQVIDTLKAAFVQGRLTKAELDARVGQAFASRTYADLAVLTADLPAGLAGDRPRHQPARAQARPPMNKAAKVAICAVIAIVVPLILAVPTGGFALVMFVPFYFMFSVVAGAQMLASRLERRSGGQSPRLPGHRRQAVEGEQSGSPGDDLILCQAHRDTRARRLLARSVTHRIWRSAPTRRVSAGLWT
jgi:Domain of unknown function (DUF1707)